ncbi:MAG: hypothetical protein FD145_367 [Candidatus Saganbacteria bacterium]|uniref:Uncharacterized protein n=1 Tax=Candidatus Saganbacteria bacterium TaxID=2575572 RepID=A0A833P3G9_UNCSA|nr:MAG: hypothetical protein FD145_367 [Candidatus Saganbacteria bacterium]
MNEKLFIFVLLIIIFIIVKQGFSLAETKPVTGNMDRSIICTAVVNAGKQPADKIFYFFSHLDKYYLELSPGHKKFQILDAQVLAKGVHIAVEENAGGQYVIHKYEVTEFILNKQIRLMSSPSIVKVGPFNIEVLTIVEFNITSDIDKEVTLVSSTLTLEFKSIASYYFAKLFRVKDVWESHLKEEMSNGMKIVESEKF